MFANSQNYPKIKCIITGSTQSRCAWYNCMSCSINYSTEIFIEYDGWLRRPSCALCGSHLVRKYIQLYFSKHKRR
jgi:NAD-dependent SIR2 family protein deacetylase